MTIRTRDDTGLESARPPGIPAIVLVIVVLAIAAGIALRLSYPNDIEFKADERWTFDEARRRAGRRALAFARNADELGRAQSRPDACGRSLPWPGRWRRDAAGTGAGGAGAQLRGAAGAAAVRVALAAGTRPRAVVLGGRAVGRSIRWRCLRARSWLPHPAVVRGGDDRRRWSATAGTVIRFVPVRLADVAVKRKHPSDRWQFLCGGLAHLALADDAYRAAMGPLMAGAALGEIPALPWLIDQAASAGGAERTLAFPIVSFWERSMQPISFADAGHRGSNSWVAVAVWRLCVAAHATLAALRSLDATRRTTSHASDGACRGRSSSVGTCNRACRGGAQRCRLRIRANGPGDYRRQSHRHLPDQRGAADALWALAWPRSATAKRLRRSGRRGAGAACIVAAL